ncbi:DUF2177 family protein [Sphingorhabdus sp. Alg239-R122]|uniref:DUF2177 family protein n=1 Tax=Sphingorhabdus sp. Alg239-R122 TaxID=2305989 RepID=UPI0013DB8999|nr:DUF2177 family protein [Sphingorhabdus sp. Alg239-R122]
MTKYLIAYFAVAIAFGILDSIWLSKMGPNLYRPILGDLLADQFRIIPAAIFYVLYIAGIVIFAVHPAFRSGEWVTALIYGGLLGFFCYATYDLTNYATLKTWSTKITVLDIIWGTFATGTAAAIGTWVTMKVSAAAA